jgi:hypothetical protein
MYQLFNVVRLYNVFIFCRRDARKAPRSARQPSWLAMSFLTEGYIIMSNGKPFEPGNTLGRGRPKGSKNKSKSKGLAMIQEHEGAIVAKVIADGLRGDKTSKVILMRTIERKAPAKFDLGPTDTPAALLKAHDKAIRAFSKRKITAADCQTLVNMLESKRRAVETLDIDLRVQAIEAALKLAKKEGPDGPTLLKKVA